MPNSKLCSDESFVIGMKEVSMGHPAVPGKLLAGKPAYFVLADGQEEAQTRRCGWIDDCDEGD